VRLDLRLLDMKFETIPLILTQFLSLEEILSVQKLGNGHIHQTLLVEVLISQKKQKYVLQQINNQVFNSPIAVMQNLEKIAQHLQQKTDYPLEVLSPIKTLKGESYFRTKEETYWRVLPFFKNTTTYSRVESPEQAFHAAKAFGQFSKALADFPINSLISTIPDFHNTLKRYKYYKKVWKQAQQNRLEKATELIAFIETNADLFDHIQQLSLPLRAVHNDTKIDNVLLNKDTKEGYCVIDLDTVMPDTILADFGDMVRTFTNSEAEDSTDYQQVEARIGIFKALCEGYLFEVKKILTGSEKKHLLDGAKWIILEQCLRFLTDYLAGDVYYPIDYSAHNLVRATNQMCLFQSIVRQEKEMKNCINKILG